MARADSKETSAARKQTLGRILNIPGVVGEPIWQELADEARVYLELHERISKEPLDSPEREASQDKMMLSLNHLAIHSHVLNKSVEEALDAAELVEAPPH